MWEYKVITWAAMVLLHHRLEIWLDEQGSEGWELCSTFHDAFIFKRPKAE